MLANLARAAARPSAGLVRRAAAATTKCSSPSVPAAAVSSAPKNLRCASSLSEVLKAEIEEERLVAFDEDVASMVKELGKKGITVKDEPGLSLVRLFGPGVGDEKVSVEFDCDVEGDGDDGWEDDLEDDSDLSLESGEQQQGKGGEGQEDEGGEDDMIGPGYRFTATITKGAKKMVLSGSATDTIAVHGIRINPANVEWDFSLYRGPDFNELDPDLQDALYDYLKERNIDDDLAAFICMYADQKEQNEYTNWLGEVAKFVK
ncbi:conserved unknown protein [Ectocarpus siliculosus]|uniref:Mitochondrial glycoprotein n=1 Tax=Ectocarpus siliculosus TaxID=2880 RepID=D7G1P8_ECTSI|nr:conserved unknown protein [Ectocarpus siliculosus]|eukprot:CBJ33293.1 conserved unknown protein [Ectocarpus siliculosus]